MTLPRYFVPRDGGVLEPLLPAARVARPIDAFELRAGARCAEWVAGFDDAGQFLAERSDTSRSLLPAAQRGVVFQEVASGGRRVVNLEALHVFEATLLEQTDCAGVDDPVFLYGSLVGPLSALPGAPSPCRIQGQLMTTRGDLLAAFVSSARWPFHRPAESGNQAESVFSALLPAERPEQIVRGAGGVIVYPVVGGDPVTEELFPGNGEMVKQILYDLLTALWLDVEHEFGDGYRSAGEIPAVGRNVGLSNYLELAAEALHMSPLWPSPAVLELNRRVEVPGAPSGPATLQVGPPQRRFFRSRGQQSPGWVETFIKAHLGPGTTSRLTTSFESSARDPRPSNATSSSQRDPWPEKTPEEVLAILDRRDR